MEDVACNLCGSMRRKDSLHGRDIRYAIPGAFTIVRCEDCGLCYVSPRPTPAEIGRYYPPTYAEHNAGPAGNPFAGAESEIVQSYFDGPGTILDIGCASGSFLWSMHGLEWQVHGVDSSPDALELARSLPGATIKLGTLERGDFPPNSFEAVTLWSVLEHLHQPLETLCAAREILKPDGRLFLVVPNYQGLERKLFQTRWFALELPRHIYHFSPDSLSKMLERAGFEVEELKHASGHDCFRFSVKMLFGRPLPDRNSAPKVSGNDSAREPTAAPPATTTAARSSGWLRRLNGVAVEAFTASADRMGMGGQLRVVARPK